MLVVVAFYWAVTSIFGGPEQNTTLAIVATLTYTMDFVRTLTTQVDVSPLGHTWSLAIEEHFYLVWPVLLLLILKLRPQYRFGAVALLIVLLEAWKIAISLQGASFLRVYFAFDTRSDQLLIGCGLAMLANGSASEAALSTLRRLWPAGMFFIPFILAKGYDHRVWAASLEFMAIALSAALLVLDISRRPSGAITNILSLPPLAFLGKISYGIYLWHYTLLVLSRYYFGPNQVCAALAIVLAVGVAALSFYFIETPFLKLKHRFDSRGASRPVTASAAHAELLTGGPEAEQA